MALRRRLAALMSLPVLAAACGGTGGAEGEIEDGVGAAEEVLCDPRFQERESVTALEDLDFEAATPEQVSDQVEQVGQDVEAIAEQVGDEASAELQQAFDQLRQAVDDLGDETMAEAEATVDQAAGQVDAAWTEAMESVEC